MCKYKPIAIITLVALVLVATLGGWALSPAPPYPAPAGQLPFRASDPVSVIVQGDSVASLDALVAQHGGVVTRELPIIRAVAADLPAAAVVAMGHDPAVARVWLDQKVRLATEPEAGTVLWRAVTGQVVDTTPAAGADGTVFVADKSNALRAFAPDGAARWSFQAAAKLLAGPVVGPDGSVYLGDKDGHFYSLTPAGELQWQFSAGKAIKAAAAVAEDGTIFFAAKKQLYALDSAGAVVGTATARAPVDAAPALSPDGGVAYFADNSGNLHAFSPTAGLLWQSTNSGRSFEHALAVGSDGSIFGAAGKWMVATDPAGSWLWSFEAAAKIGGAPAVGPDGHLYFGDHNGTLYELDGTGQLLRSVQLGQSIKTGAAAAADGTVLAAAKKTLRASNPLGDATFEFQADARITAGPVLSADGSIAYIADQQKNLYAIATGLVPPAAVPDTAYARVVGAQNVWAEGITGNGVGVAVVDSGIAPLPSLVVAADGDLRLVGWADMVDGSPVPIDPNGHGTHVAGIIANSAVTEFGHYAGVAPNVNLIGVRVIDQTGAGTYADAIAGIDWVVANKEFYGIRVMNLSFTTPPQSHYWEDPLNQAVMAAWAADIVVVAAAGNGGPAPMTIGVPGNVPYVITVGAFTDNYTPDNYRDDYLAPFSAAGPTWDGYIKPDVVAPGAHMVSLMPADSHLGQLYVDRQVAEDYYQMAGTSTSAPVVTAICAMVLEANPALSADQVKYRVLTSARLAVQDSDGDGTLDRLAVSPWQQGTGHVWAADAALSTATGSANSNLNVLNDLAGTEHYIGPTLYHEAANAYYIQADGEFVWNGSEYVWNGGEFVWNGGEYVWNGGEYVWNGGEFVWNGGEYVWNGGEYVWNGGEYVWNGGEYVWNGGEYVWNGSEYVWNGGEYVWNGSEYVWNGGEYVWNGGEYVWNGGEYVWNGGEYVWNGGEYIWNGGEYVWNGGEYVWNGGLDQVAVSLGLWIPD